MPSGIAALLIASVPLWSVVLRFATRERLNRATAAAVLVGFGGGAIEGSPEYDQHLGVDEACEAKVEEYYGGLLNR